MGSLSRTGGSIPGIGKVELSWASNPAPAITEAASNGEMGKDVDMADGAAPATASAAAPGLVKEKEEEDYDVADGDEGEMWTR